MVLVEVQVMVLEKKTTESGVELHAGSLFEALDRYSDIPEQQKRRVLPLLRVRTFRRGEFFVRAGGRILKHAFVVSGLLRSFYISEDGREFTHGFPHEGDFISVIADQNYDIPSYYFIQAVEECTLLTIKKEDWISLRDSSLDWLLFHIQLLETSIREFNERNRSLVFDDVKKRYQTLLGVFPTIESRVKQHELAQYLGATPFSLSRIRRKIAEEAGNAPWKRRSR